MAAAALAVPQVAASSRPVSPTAPSFSLDPQLDPSQTAYPNAFTSFVSAPIPYTLPTYNMEASFPYDSFGAPTSGQMSNDWLRMFDTATYN